MGLELSLLFAFGAMLCWGIEDFLAQKSARKIGDMESLAFIVILGSLILIPFVKFSVFSLKSLSLLFVFAIIHFIAGIFFFESLKKGKLSVVDVLFELELPITLILGVVLFTEKFSVLQLLFMSLIFIGIILIATKSFSHWKSKLEKGVIYAIFAAIAFSFVNFTSAFSARNIAPLESFWAIWIFMSIFSLIYLFYKGDISKTIKNGFKFKFNILPMAVLATFAWLFYFLATSQKSLGVITSITESYPAISIFLGVWINREKINWHQWLGVGIALGASFTLAFIA